MFYVFCIVMVLFLIPIVATNIHFCKKNKNGKSQSCSEQTNSKNKRYYKENNSIKEDIKNNEIIEEVIKNNGKCAIELEEETEQQDNSIEVDISKKD